eukprot:6172890-Pleurochrysis_carterae.AAC.4
MQAKALLLSSACGACAIVGAVTTVLALVFVPALILDGQPLAAFIPLIIALLGGVLFSCARSCGRYATTPFETVAAALVNCVALVASYAVYSRVCLGAQESTWACYSYAHHSWHPLSSTHPRGCHGRRDQRAVESHACHHSNGGRRVLCDRAFAHELGSLIRDMDITQECLAQLCVVCMRVVHQAQYASLGVPTRKRSRQPTWT